MPRIKYTDRQNTLLRAENNSMKQKLSNFSGELMFKEGIYPLILTRSLWSPFIFMISSFSVSSLKQYEWEKNIAAEFEDLKQERDMLKQLFETYQKQQQVPPEMLRASSGNYQFPTMGLNVQLPAEDADDNEPNEMPQIMQNQNQNQNPNQNLNQNQNQNQLGNAEFMEYMNSLSLDPSYNFLWTF